MGDTHIVRRWQAGFEPEAPYMNSTSAHPSPVLQTQDTHICPAQNLCRCCSYWVPGSLPSTPEWSPDPPHPSDFSLDSPGRLPGPSDEPASPLTDCKRLCTFALTKETCWLRDDCLQMCTWSLARTLHQSLLLGEEKDENKL